MCGPGQVWESDVLRGFEEASVSTALQNYPEMPPSLKRRKKYCVCGAKALRQMALPGLTIRLWKQPSI